LSIEKNKIFKFFSKKSKKNLDAQAVTLFFFSLNHTPPISPDGLRVCEAKICLPVPKADRGKCRKLRTFYAVLYAVGRFLLFQIIN